MLSDAYGREAVKKSSVFQWHKWFREGCKNVEDDEISGHSNLKEPMKMYKSVESGAFK